MPEPSVKSEDAAQPALEASPLTLLTDMQFEAMEVDRALSAALMLLSAAGTESAVSWPAGDRYRDAKQITHCRKHLQHSAADVEGAPLMVPGSVSEKRRTYVSAALCFHPQA